MPDNQHDPAASTQQFRAFVSRGQGAAGEPAQGSGLRTAALVTIVFGAVAVLAAIGLLAVALLK